MAAYLGIDALSGASPLGYAKHHGIGAMLGQFGSNTALYSNYLFSNVSGCIGEVSLAMILVGLLFLVFLRIIDIRIPLMFVSTLAILCMIFGIDPLFFALAGGTLFVAAFMITDYVTTPNTLKGRILFAIGCAVLTFIFRVYSSNAEGITYAVLLMNSVSPMIDRLTKPKPFGYVKKK
jgi:Na+-translocating ferredoxin:NAD+ oxidoreductase subunit D